MPVIEYEREDGTRFDKLQRFSDADLEECPTTGQTCKRVWSGAGPAVIYRCGGFYTTDYKGSTLSDGRGESGIAPTPTRGTRTESFTSAN